jgi:hypothetical protein
MQVVYVAWTPSVETKKVVDYGIQALCLDKVPGWLHIFKNIDNREGVVADCFHDGLDDYEIRLWTEDVSAILHEMVHVMQYANYELEVYSEGRGYWQGKLYENLTYEESPWEIEAFRLEEILVKNFKADCLISS